MLQRLQKAQKSDDKGFTLIELLVVVVIIGILAAIAIPLFLSQKDKATEAGVKSDLKNASTYMETFFVDNATYVNADLAAAGFKATNGVTTTVASSTINSYCLDGVSTTGKHFHLDSAKGYVEAKSCAGVA